MKMLFGSPSKESSSSSTGYSALPQSLRDSFDPLGAAIGKYTNPDLAGVTQAFTPAPVSAGETGAMNAINAGFAPTQTSVGADMALQMNPYNESVINEINRQGQGQYSVLKQAMDAAGQTDSNRTLLGANDIDLSRQNLIGSFLGNQFNTAMQNALTTLPGMRSQDATRQMGVGDFLRQLQMQTQLAPVTALQAGTGMLAPFTAGGVQAGSSTGGSKGLFDYAAAAGQGYAMSDRRLKENIQHIGKENGHNIYTYNYIGMPEKYIGVMADEVQEKNPEAVQEFGGYLAVNYPMIGVVLREVSNGIL